MPKRNLQSDSVALVSTALQKLDVLTMRGEVTKCDRGYYRKLLLDAEFIEHLIMSVKSNKILVITDQQLAFEYLSHSTLKDLPEIILTKIPCFKDHVLEISLDSGSHIINFIKVFVRRVMSQTLHDVPHMIGADLVVYESNCPEINLLQNAHITSLPIIFKSCTVFLEMRFHSEKEDDDSLQRACTRQTLLEQEADCSVENLVENIHLELSSSVEGSDRTVWGFLEEATLLSILL